MVSWLVRKFWPIFPEHSAFVQTRSCHRLLNAQWEEKHIVCFASSNSQPNCNGFDMTPELRTPEGLASSSFGFWKGLWLKAGRLTISPHVPHHHAHLCTNSKNSMSARGAALRQRFVWEDPAKPSDAQRCFGEWAKGDKGWISQLSDSPQHPVASSAKAAGLSQPTGNMRKLCVATATTQGKGCSLEPREVYLCTCG